MRSAFAVSSFRVDVVLEPVARAVDGHDVAVVQEPVQDGGSKYVVAEDPAPFTWNWHRFVGED